MEVPRRKGEDEMAVMKYVRSTCESGRPDKAGISAAETLELASVEDEGAGGGGEEAAEREGESVAASRCFVVCICRRLAVFCLYVTEMRQMGVVCFCATVASKPLSILMLVRAGMVITLLE